MTDTGGDVPGDVTLGADGMRRLVDVAPQVTVVFDEGLVVRFVSAAGEELFAQPVERVLGTSIADHIADRDLHEVTEAVAFVHETGTYGRPLEFSIVRADGSERQVEGIARNLLGDPTVAGYVAVLRDITDRHLIDEVLAAVMRNAIVDETLGLIAELTAEQLGSAAVAIAFHLDRPGGPELVARGLPEPLWPSGDDDHARAPWAEPDSDPHPALRAVSVLPADLAAAAQAGGLVGWFTVPVALPATAETVALLSAWFTHTDPLSPAGYQALARLVRLTAFALERWRYDRLLEHAARHDHLTELPNREQFFGRLRAALAPRLGTRPVAVLYLDLDRFKPVNDTFGHGVGDRLLEVVARRLQGSVRVGDLVARLGGDEFAVVCPGLGRVPEATELAARLVAAVAEPVTIDGVRVEVGASVGIAIGSPGDDPDEVLQRADTALYEAKRAGRGGFALAPVVDPPVADVAGSGDG